MRKISSLPSKNASSQLLPLVLTAAALTSVSSPLYAKEPIPTDTHTRAADNSNAPSAKTIIVTGSRLNLEALTGTEPLVFIPAAQIEEQNYSHFADALNDFPGFRGSLTPDGQQDQFGQGVNFINAYGLGSNRTLTLLNGKRVVSSNSPTAFPALHPALRSISTRSHRYWWKG